jgi:hypothetical protein
MIHFSAQAVWTSHTWDRAALTSHPWGLMIHFSALAVWTNHTWDRAALTSHLSLSAVGGHRHKVSLKKSMDAATFFVPVIGKINLLQRQQRNHPQIWAINQPVITRI